MTTKGDLLRAYNETSRVQLEMGVDPEVMADIGYGNFEDTAILIEQATPQVAKVAEAIGAVTCGDCGQVIPCAHAGITKSGRGYTKGN